VLFSHLRLKCSTFEQTAVSGDDGWIDIAVDDEGVLHRRSMI
jgi:hypothetical protein